MLFVYVDDILALTHHAKDCIKEITEFYKVKEGSIKPPEVYLGVNMSRMQLPNGHKVWATSPRTYVKNSIGVVECLLEEDGEGYVLKLNVNPFKPKKIKQDILF